jgi:3D (Asp-Asp-Asp) domain-containing protein
MKKSTKYLIARLVIMALVGAICFGIGWVSKKPKTVTVEVEKPVIQECNHKEEKKEEPKVTYKAMEIVATAYCPCVKCCGKSDGITSTGVKAKANHTVAADPKYYPYGTEILCGMGEFVVEDCGGAIKGENRFDFFFDTHEEAKKIRQTKIYNLG